MASTYVNDLRLNELATGDASGTWGTITNTNLELIAEAFSFGTEGITTNADTHTSTIADGATDPVRSMYVKYTGTLDSACTITIAPNTVSKLWFIENGTSGSQNIIISQGTGANVTIPAGDTKVVYSDGAGSGAAVVDAFASLSTVDLKVQDDLTVTDDASVGGDLLVSGEVQTANIGFTDGDNAITIADGGGITAANGITSTAAANTFGATSFNDANITNVGDIALDSLSADDSSISIASPVVINGSTPTLTIGDAGAEDTKIVFNGNAQDYYIGLDDSADDLIIGKGSTVGTTPAVVIDENLNVGIGTTSPARPLHIENAEGRLVRLSHTSNPKIEFVDTTNGTSGAYLGSEDNELTFETSGQNERMRIDAAGNVGIGAAPTLGALHVTSSLTDIVTFENTDAGTTGAQLLLYHNSSSPADGDRVGALAFQGKDDGGNHTTYAGIRCLATDVSDGGEDGTLTFSCTREGSFTEAMRIDSGGGVAIGTTSPDGVSNLTVKSQNSTASQEFVSLHHQATSGLVYFISFMTEASGVDRGYITYNNSTNTVGFTQASDEILKENIRDLTGGLDFIKQIKPRVFDWKEEGRGKDQVGFIAQEIETIKPEWVGKKEGLKNIPADLTGTVPYLIKAIQEQQTLIETLQAKVEALENG
jgi:hypothetical protein